MFGFSLVGSGRGIGDRCGCVCVCVFRCLPIHTGKHVPFGRASSMVAYSCEWPGLLAPLLDPKLRDQFVLKFKVASEAFGAAAMHDLPIARMLASLSLIHI